MHRWAELLSEWPAEFTTGYNVAPTSMVPVYFPEGWQAMRWSLIPPWSKEISSRYATFNARAESVAEKPAYRHAWKHSQRCLIPALGYYEWREDSGGKQPFFITAVNEDPLMFGGLWEPARDDIPASCTIVTREADSELRPLHHRMPALMSPDTAEAWLHDDPEIAAELIQSPRPVPVQYYAVSKAVNNTRNNSESLIQPLDA